MKRLIALALLLVFVFSACGPMYTVKRDKKGIYRTAELEFNILATDKGDWGDFVLFNLVKYMHGSSTFYAAKIGYSYPEKGWEFFGMGPGVAGFGIRWENGVMIRINNGKTVPLKFKGRPDHKVYISRATTTNTYSGGMMTGSYTTGSDSRTHVETVECVLTPAQLAYLVNAKSIVITLYGTIHEKEPQDKEKKVEYYFKGDNFKIIKRFYDEEVKGGSI